MGIHDLLQRKLYRLPLPIFHKKKGMHNVEKKNAVGTMKIALFRDVLPRHSNDVILINVSNEPTASIYPKILEKNVLYLQIIV
jgi:hypothetical protein